MFTSNKTDPMEISAVIKNVRRLSSFIDDAFLKSESKKFQYFQTDFTAFHKTIEIAYNNWFPNAKPCKDEDIINQVFRDDIEEKDFKVWVKFSISCLLQSSKRVYNNIVDYNKNEDKDLFLCELRLLSELAFEAAILMETSFNIVEKRQVEFGYGKRFYIHARETFDASRQILRKFITNNTLGDFVLGPTSIFLLRQSIELWLFEIFDINCATDENNNLIKLQPERLFDLIDNSGEKVKCPVSKSVIMKIHKWSQPYVHAGWMPFIWEIEHAQFVLGPIFNLKNIIIKKEHYDNLEKELQNILSVPFLKLIRNKK